MESSAAIAAQRNAQFVELQKLEETNRDLGEKIASARRTGNRTELEQFGAQQREVGAQVTAKYSELGPEAKLDYAQFIRNSNNQQQPQTVAPLDELNDYEASIILHQLPAPGDGPFQEDIEVRPTIPAASSSDLYRQWIIENAILSRVRSERAAGRPMIIANGSSFEPRVNLGDFLATHGALRQFNREYEVREVGEEAVLRQKSATKRRHGGETKTNGSVTDICADTFGGTYENVPYLIYTRPYPAAHYDGMLPMRAATPDEQTSWIKGELPPKSAANLALNNRPDADDEGTLGQLLESNNRLFQRGPMNADERRRRRTWLRTPAGIYYEQQHRSAAWYRRELEAANLNPKQAYYW
jgi:hypothetical protein